MIVEASMFTLFVIGSGILGLSYSVFSWVRIIRKRTERRERDASLQAARDTPPSSIDTGALLPPTHEAVAATALPTLKPMPPKPPPNALRAWVPLVMEGPPHFNRYISWPRTKLTTPTAEKTPTERDYVWE